MRVKKKGIYKYGSFYMYIVFVTDVRVYVNYVYGVSSLTSPLAITFLATQFVPLL